MTLALDRAATLSRIERMKLVMEYGQIRKQVSGGELTRMAKLRLVMRANEIRALLGASTEKPAENEHVSLLRSVISGAHDALDIKALLEKIGAAIEALHQAGDLAGEIDQLGERAIEHWAVLVPVEG